MIVMTLSKKKISQLIIVITFLVIKKLVFMINFFLNGLTKVLQRHYGIHIVEEKLAFKLF